MFCDRNAVRSSLAMPEHTCPARVSHAASPPSPSPPSIPTALAAANIRTQQRPVQIRLLPLAVSPLVPRHAALHTLTACVVRCRRMLAGPRVMMGELNGAGWCD